MFDFLKKNKKEEVKEEKKIKKTKEPKKAKKAVVEPIKPTEKKPIAEKEKAKAKAKVKQRIGYKVLKVPHISEKATDLVEKNQYVFNVSTGANKQEIKQAVKEIYGVDVVSVNVINIPRRKRRVGKTMGWKQGYRKAIVKIKQGQKIELLPR